MKYIILILVALIGFGLGYRYHIYRDYLNKVLCSQDEEDLYSDIKHQAKLWGMTPNDITNMIAKAATITNTNESGMLLTAVGREKIYPYHFLQREEEEIRRIFQEEIKKTFIKTVVPDVQFSPSGWGTSNCFDRTTMTNLMLIMTGKPITYNKFYKSKYNLIGYQSWCIECLVLNKKKYPTMSFIPCTL